MRSIRCLDHDELTFCSCPEMNYICPVKYNSKIFRGTILAIIYCIVVSGSIAGASKDFAQKGHPSKTHGKYFSPLSPQFLFHLPQQESLGNSSDGFPLQNLGSQYHSLQGTVKHCELLLEARFAQYRNFSRNFLVHHRKTDIIFPFHYYW